ncbi:hypothetical protein ACHAXS_014365 [Conticribra weissflogii]
MHVSLTMNQPQKNPTSILRSSSSLTARSTSKKNASFSSDTDNNNHGGIISTPSSASSTAAVSKTPYTTPQPSRGTLPSKGIRGHDRRVAARIRATILLFILIVAVLSSFYLSYGVILQNMKKNNQFERGGLSINTKAKEMQSWPKDNRVGKSEADEKILKGGAPPSSSNNKMLESQHNPIALEPETNANTESQEFPPEKMQNVNKCAFRTYLPSRYYGLSNPISQQPPFLSDAVYIRGEWPIILNPLEEDGIDSNAVTGNLRPKKVCLDTTSWEETKDGDGVERWPFTDGHNPSVVSLASNPYILSTDDDEAANNSFNSSKHTRLDPKHIEPISKSLPDHSIDSLYLSVSIFGSGQCRFGMSDQDVEKYKFSTKEEPPGGKRTVIAVLSPPNTNDDHDSFETLTQTTLLLERDVSYGTRKKSALPPRKDENGTFLRMHQEFDDPRLFFYDGRLWVLYRNGPLFGYKDQIHNPIHFESATSSEEAVDADGGNPKLVAYVKASETIRVCCGRNIALISEEAVARSNGGDSNEGSVEWLSNPSLKALTWVDPVTVVDVNIGDVVEGRRLEEEGVYYSPFSTKNRQITLERMKSERIITDERPSNRNMFPIFTFEMDEPRRHHRRLGLQQQKSNIHGTNGYMIPLPSTGELLGIAHFHRPEDRQSSNFALHGHHYTHVFFTIARQVPTTLEDGTATYDDINSRPFKLKRLSNEFAFRSLSLPSGEDADIIQFASGLDVVGSDMNGKLIVSYGINDCEGAVFTMPMEKLQSMLIDVAPGQEVSDLMMKVVHS